MTYRGNCRPRTHWQMTTYYQTAMRDVNDRDFACSWCCIDLTQGHRNSADVCLSVRVSEQVPLDLQLVPERVRSRRSAAPG